MTTVQKQHPITVRAVDGKSIRMLVSVEPEMVDQREVGAVVRGVGLGHPVILAPDLTTVDRGSAPHDTGCIRVPP
jgi:uncharacterized protein YifN (PemK superfamily)